MVLITHPLLVPGSSMGTAIPVSPFSFCLTCYGTALALPYWYGKQMSLYIQVLGFVDASSPVKCKKGVQNEEKMAHKCETMKHCRWIAISVIPTKTLSPDSFSIKSSDVTVEVVRKTISMMSYLSGAVIFCRIHRLVYNTSTHK